MTQQNYPPQKISINKETEVDNPYIPSLVTITDIVTENDVNDLKTFKLEFQQKADKDKFYENFVPGQFAELSAFGFGESPIGIASSPTEEDYLLFTIKKAGKVTTHFHDSKIGKVIGIRGPFGNGWPLNKMQVKNLVSIGGGFAFTTLRSLITYILSEDNRPKFGNLNIIYGCRSPGEFCYKQTLSEWEQREDMELTITIDREVEGWKKKVGFVPTITKEISPSPENAIAIVCGPAIMLKYTLPVLQELGFADESILLSLEMRMKCGIGKCGRCNVGKKFVCIDGPVFSQAELNRLLKD
ncbi:MAG: heterodisulfide reductase subunit F [Promethearchaeota archaeon]|nr:MAG: heterodisulfide reductase subunit F [Candidatus Lokiarchaeota archaeon]